jgi:hypothetical protein
LVVGLSASPIASSTARAAGVYRACGLLSPGTCSMNVTAAHAGCRQRNRRTTRLITTWAPPIAASTNRRTYRPCTRPETVPHPGHATCPARERATIHTPPAERSTRSTTTPDR